MKNFLMLVIFSSPAFLASFSQADCAPAVGSTIETSQVMGAPTFTGAAADQELRDGPGKIKFVQDQSGRVLFVESLATGPVSTLVVGDATANSRVDEYCSESKIEDAQCVQMCVRWTNYQDNRI